MKIKKGGYIIIKSGIDICLSYLREGIQDPKFEIVTEGNIEFRFSIIRNGVDATISDNSAYAISNDYKDNGVRVSVYIGKRIAYGVCETIYENEFPVINGECECVWDIDKDF